MEVVMNKSRRFAILVILAALAISVLPRPRSTAIALCQLPLPVAPSERDRGIRLYEQGDASGAIEALRVAVKQNAEDGKAWHYLGLAFQLHQDKDKARKAFENAAKIRVRELANISIPSGGENRTDTAARYEAAFESVQKYVDLTPNASRDWIAELETLGFYQGYYSGTRNDEEIVSGKEATLKVRILEKPAPDFSGTRASGTSVLRALFASDGTIKHVLVLRGVEPRFDHACIEAAKSVKFEPAIKDGHKVSMILQLEYNRQFF
jgi:tetratricopeptide (TPR) repeat protein